MDKAYKALDEEKDAEKALAEFIKEQDTAYCSLMERVNKVKQRHQVLTELEAESGKITKWGNIIAFKKQATNKEVNTLTEEQMERLKSELQDRRVLLNDSCKMVNHTQEGIDYLLKLMEAAKKLIMDINDRYAQCREDWSLNVSIQKLEYSIKLTLRKVKEIRDHIESNTERQEVTKGRAVRGEI